MSVKKEVMVEISARHMHVSREHLDILFGKGYELVNKKDLSQPGQYACEEKVTVVGGKGEMKMSILGPVRPDTQVEVSLTDARTLGIDAPVRESGDIAGTPGCKLVGPKGEVTIDKGVIAAKAHIHFATEEASEYGICDKDLVSVRICGAREITISNVVARVNPNFKRAMHIDTDEANAAGIKGTVNGEIV